jgi:hypothetical protein
MTDEKCCGQPINCTRDCFFATLASGYVADHVHNQYGASETGVTSPIDDKIQRSTLFRVLGKKPDAAHFGDLLRDATFAGGAPVDPPKSVNPKDGIGNTKLPLHLWPFSATAHGSLALLDGMLKYGRLNWRGTEVRASVYVGALMRHVAEWMEGQTSDPKSGLHPLAHALACIAILLDAEAAGTLIDDRNYPGGYAELAEALTPHVARLQVLYAGVKAPHHWTIADVAAPEAVGSVLAATKPNMASASDTDA